MGASENDCVGHVVVVDSSFRRSTMSGSVHTWFFGLIHALRRPDRHFEGAEFRSEFILTEFMMYGWRSVKRSRRDEMRQLSKIWWGTHTLICPHLGAKITEMQGMM